MKARLLGVFVFGLGVGIAFGSLLPSVSAQGVRVEYRVFGEGSDRKLAEKLNDAARDGCAPTLFAGHSTEVFAIVECRRE